MRTALILLLALLPAAGCARKKPPPLVVLPQAAPGPGGTAAPGWTDRRPNGPANPVYQGRTPPQWAEQLQNPDHVARSQASIALANMGDAGYPHLREGMRSRTVEVRLASVQAIGKETLIAHRSEMIPVLTGMLRDPEPMLRRAAAARLCWFGADARSALGDLRTVAEKDEEPDIRQVASLSIQIIENPDAPPDRDTPADGQPPKDD